LLEILNMLREEILNRLRPGHLNRLPEEIVSMLRKEFLGRGDLRREKILQKLQPENVRKSRWRTSWPRTSSRRKIF